MDQQVWALRWFFKEAVRKDMLDENSPLVFWDYFADRRDHIKNVKTNYFYWLRGKTPHFATFGEEGDISNICQFGWYEWVYLCETTTEFPFWSRVICRCLRPTKNKGNEMTQWVLKTNWQIVPRWTMWRLTTNKLVRDSEVKNRAGFDAATKFWYGD